MSVYSIIQWKHDTAANWTANDPILALGEAGYETDTGKVKVGDGTTAWTSLSYNFTGGAGAAHSVGMSTNGNTAGNTGYGTDRLVFAGGNNITLSGSTNGGSMTITISGAAGGGAGYTAGVSTGGNTLGNSGVVTGQLVLAGGNNVTLSGSTNAGSMTITVSGPNTVAQTNQSLGIYGSSQTTGQSSSSTYDARSLSIVGMGANSVGWSGGSLLISAPNTIAQTAESNTFGMSNLGNTSGTTGVVSGAQVRMLFVGGNNVTLSQSLNGVSGTITISASQTVRNNELGVSTIGNTSGNTGMQISDGLRFVLAGGNNITLSVSTNGAASQTITISGPNTVAQTNQSLGIYGSSQTVGASSSSTHDARSLTVVGRGAVSVGWTNGSFQISAPDTIAQTNQTLGLYHTGNTTGQSSSSTRDARSLSFSGLGIASVGMSAGMVLISVPAGGGAGDGGASVLISTQGNTAGDTGYVTSGNLQLVGSDNITLSNVYDGTNMIVSIIGAGGGAGITQLSTQNRQLGASSHSAAGQNSVWVAPFRANNYISASTALLMVTYTGSVTSNQTNTLGLTQEFAFYTAPESNQSSFSRLWSTSFGQTFWNSGTASVSYASGTYTTSSAGSNLMTASIYGLRLHTFTIGSTFSPGLYAYAYRMSTSSAGNSSILRTFNMVIDNPLAVAGGYMGSATNNSVGYADAGTWSATTATLPATFNMTDVGQVLNRAPFIKIGAI